MEMYVNSILKKHENEKKIRYNRRVMEVEQGTFTPLIITTTRVLSLETQIFHKSLVSFLALKATLLCLRGSRPRRITEEKCEDFKFINIYS